jgi:WD40 repeat protein
MYRFGGLLLVLSSFSLIFAQDAEPLLLISLTVPDAGIVHNDLYRYTDNQWEPVTSGGYKGGFSLSPDGSQIVYQIAPDFLRVLIEEYGAGHLSSTAWDIAILDLTTSEQRVIAGQPSDVEISEDNQNFSGGVDRSEPVWSPDGNAIAWTEQDYPEQDGVARLVMVEVATGEIRVLDDALPQMNLSSDGLPNELSWGESGIAVFTNDPNDLEETIHLYDPATGTTQIIRDTDSGEAWRPVTEMLWVDDELLVINAGGFNWLTVDPISGTANGMGNQLEFVSAAIPDASLRLLRDIYALPGAGEWQLLSPDGTVLESWGEELQLAQFVMSPSGQAIAYLQNSEVYLWQDGAAITLPLPEGLTANELCWGHMSVRFGAEYDSLG